MGMRLSPRHCILMASVVQLMVECVIGVGVVGEGVAEEGVAGEGMAGKGGKWVVVQQGTLVGDTWVGGRRQEGTPESAYTVAEVEEVPEGEVPGGEVPEGEVPDGEVPKGEGGGGRAREVGEKQ